MEGDAPGRGRGGARRPRRPAQPWWVVGAPAPSPAPAPAGPAPRPPSASGARAKSGAARGGGRGGARGGAPARAAGAAGAPPPPRCPPAGGGPGPAAPGGPRTPGLGLSGPREPQPNQPRRQRKEEQREQWEREQREREREQRETASPEEAGGPEAGGSRRTAKRRRRRAAAGANGGGTPWFQVRAAAGPSAGPSAGPAPSLPAPAPRSAAEPRDAFDIEDLEGADDPAAAAGGGPAAAPGAAAGKRKRPWKVDLFRAADDVGAGAAPADLPPPASPEYATRGRPFDRVLRSPGLPKRPAPVAAPRPAAAARRRGLLAGPVVDTEALQTQLDREVRARARSQAERLSQESLEVGPQSPDRGEPHRSVFIDFDGGLSDSGEEEEEEAEGDADNIAGEGRAPGWPVVKVEPGQREATPPPAAAPPGEPAAARPPEVEVDNLGSPQVQFSCDFSEEAKSADSQEEPADAAPQSQPKAAAQEEAGSRRPAAAAADGGAGVPRPDEFDIEKLLFSGEKAPHGGAGEAAPEAPAVGDFLKIPSPASPDGSSEPSSIFSEKEEDLSEEVTPSLSTRQGMGAGMVRQASRSRPVHVPVPARKRLQLSSDKEHAERELCTAMLNTKLIKHYEQGADWAECDYVGRPLDDKRIGELEERFQAIGEQAGAIFSETEIERIRKKAGEEWARLKAVRTAAAAAQPKIFTPVPRRLIVVPPRRASVKGILKAPNSGGKRKKKRVAFAEEGPGSGAEPMAVGAA